MLKHVLHTGVEVADLAKMISFYKGLGFEVSNQFEKPEPKAKVAILKRGDVAFELWQFEDSQHPQVRFIRNHIAFYSDDLEHDVQNLVQQGFRLVIPITEGVIMRYAFVQDAADSCFEIATEKGVA